MARFTTRTSSGFDPRPHFARFGGAVAAGHEHLDQAELAGPGDWSLLALAQAAAVTAASDGTPGSVGLESRLALVRDSFVRGDDTHFDRRFLADLLAAHGAPLGADPGTVPVPAEALTGTASYLAPTLRRVFARWLGLTRRGVSLIDARAVLVHSVRRAGDGADVVGTVKDLVMRWEMLAAAVDAPRRGYRWLALPDWVRVAVAPAHRHEELAAQLIGRFGTVIDPAAPDVAVVGATGAAGRWAAVACASGLDVAVGALRDTLGLDDAARWLEVLRDPAACARIDAQITAGRAQSRARPGPLSTLPTDRGR